MPISLSTLLEKAKEFKYQVYCDMDGVLTWFERALSELTQELYGVSYNLEQLAQVVGSMSKAWKLIGQKEGFWYMSWQPGGRVLWDKLKWYVPTILTSPGGNISQCKKEKIKWVQDNLGMHVSVKFAENGKGKYASKNAILIDDMDKNLNDWKAAGGIAIKHESAEKTIKSLQDIILNKTSPVQKAKTKKYIRRYRQDGKWVYVYKESSVKSGETKEPIKDKAGKLKKLKVLIDKVKIAISSDQVHKIAIAVTALVKFANEYKVMTWINKAAQDEVKDLIKASTFSGHKLHKRRRFMGMNISVENRRGSSRHWKDDQGNEGTTKMLFDYGYIRGTEGKDGDHVDVFLGANENAPYAFVIHQNRPDNGKYDEDKVMLGFDTAEAAKKAYLKHYDSVKFFGGMKAMPIDKFKERVYKTLNGRNKSLKAEIHKALKQTNVKIRRKVL